MAELSTKYKFEIVTSPYGLANESSLKGRLFYLTVDVTTRVQSAWVRGRGGGGGRRGGGGVQSASCSNLPDRT